MNSRGHHAESLKQEKEEDCDVNPIAEPDAPHRP
jgi:hypothetical protein